MRRRNFIALLGSAVGAWPITARAQQRNPPTIGVLVGGNPDPGPFIAALREGLRELGYIEEKSIRLEIRSAHGNFAELPALARKLVDLKPDVIVVFQTPAAEAAKKATTIIPIVLEVADPVGTGLVDSLARPGGNITGVSATITELGAKNLELAKEALPRARRVAILGDTMNPFSKPFTEQALAAAKTLDIEAKSMPVRPAGELESAFADLSTWRADAVLVLPSLPLKHVADLALKHRLPSFAPRSEFAAAGGLIAYSADLEALYHECAVFVDKILKGRKPADLPVELPTKFRLVVNLKTARALALDLPPTMLTRADEVIE
jgi:putative ABC transport system substrate-binding protein